jgi:hypothetical protein
MVTGANRLRLFFAYVTTMSGLRLSTSDVSVLLLLYGVRMKTVGPSLKNNGDSLDIVLC